MHAYLNVIVKAAGSWLISMQQAESMSITKILKLYHGVGSERSVNSIKKRLNQRIVSANVRA
jgi:hypothetical protein